MGIQSREEGTLELGDQGEKPKQHKSRSADKCHDCRSYNCSALCNNQSHPCPSGDEPSTMTNLSASRLRVREVQSKMADSNLLTYPPG